MRFSESVCSVQSTPKIAQKNPKHCPPIFILKSSGYTAISRNETQMNFQSDVVRHTFCMKCAQVFTMKSWERANTLRHRESSKNPCQSCQPRQLFLWQTSFPSDALEQLNKPLASVSASPAATLRTRVEQVEQVKPWITSNHISKKFRDMFSGEAPQSDSKQGWHSPQRRLHVDHVCSCKAEIKCSKGKCATGAD